MRGRSTILGIAACVTAAAQTLPTTIRISDEITPPGGMAQMKVLLTSPKPITSGGMSVDMSDVWFDSIDGIALFSPNGDVYGAGVVNGGKVNMRFTSPNSTFGSSLDYPIMTVALRLSAGAVKGQIFPVRFDQAGSFWQDLLGSSISVELQPGSITVGGSVSITNVIPGGGAIPAGGTFRILGMGFSKDTKLQLAGLRASSVQVVSPTELLVTVKDAGVLDGTKIQVQNADKSSDTYYSYMRGVAAGTTARPVLARTVPAFSTSTLWEANIPPTISPLVNADYFTGVAVQNPNAAAAPVIIEARSSTGDVTGSVSLSLPAGGKFVREASELFGSVLPTGSYLHVLSSLPIQAMGLLGNDATGVVLPLSPAVISAPPPPPPVDPGTSGKVK